MKILITSSTRSGAWQIRGVQLGSALDARVRVRLSPLPDDVEWADIVVIVKRAQPSLLKALKGAKKIVWDTVDFWKQPTMNFFTREEIITEFHREAYRINPDAVICATEKMREDCGADFALYHHHRPDIQKAVVNQDIKRIGYDGNIQFLGHWRDYIERECRLRGWEFVHTDQIHTCDAVVAFRGGKFDGYAPHCWKSNVKLANAQGAGVPIICNSAMGYLETDKGGVLYCDNPKELGFALDKLTYAYRKRAHGELLRSAYTVDQAAYHYKAFLDGL